MDYKFVNVKELKTYKKVYNNTSKTNKEAGHFKQDKKVPLSTQNAIKYLLDGTLRLRVCRYCLSVTSKLSELDEIFTLAVSGSIHDVSLRDIIASFHPFKVSEDPNFPNKICSECVNRAMSCYLFSQQCERAERALRNCFEDIHDKFEKLDPLEPVKKRGKRKLNPNYNILYTEHLNVINYAEPIINIINIDLASNYGNEISDLECPKCWQVLPNTELLLNHEKSHPKTMWYNCRLCGKSFVKRYHLRKHLKKEHKENNETADTNDKHFQCNKCGSFCETLGEHLQHIEKHKFKTMFNCLIDRKIDSLCSVCFEKSNNLANLSEVVYLHGGYPGLTGDKRIEDILTDTIPGQNPFKYRELLVQHKAKIIKLVKRKLHPDKNKSFSQVIEDDSTKKTKDLITSLSSKEENAIESIQAVPFIFSKPDQPNPIYLVDNAIIATTDYSHNDYSNTVNYLPDDPCVKVITSLNKSESILKIDISCKICWIFGKATCKSCLELIKKGSKISAIDKKYDNIDKQRGDCKYCWIFKKAGQCSYCNKYLYKNEAAISNITDLTYFPSHVGHGDNVVILKSDISSKSLKEQKSAIWQCHICLSINPKNILICLCCEETKDNQANQDYNFSNGEIFYGGLKNNKSVYSDKIKQSKLYTGYIQEIATKAQNIIIVNSKLTIPDVGKPMKDLNVFESDIKNVLTVYNTNNQLGEILVPKNEEEILPFKAVNNSPLLEPNKKDMIEEIPMDYEIIPTNFNESREHGINLDVDHLDDMDIDAFAENFTNSHTLESTSQYISSSKAISSHSYTFHLGVGDSVNTKNRRIKMPIRRMAFNKH